MEESIVMKTILEFRYSDSWQEVHPARVRCTKVVSYVFYPSAAFLLLVKR